MEPESSNGQPATEELLAEDVRRTQRQQPQARPRTALELLCEVAEIRPAQLEQFFADPTKLFDVLTLADIQRLQRVCEQIAAVEQQVAVALQGFATFARGYMTARAERAEAEAAATGEAVGPERGG